ncbi:MAG: adenosylcobalamin-dependent ribonucleoside-diphosphate reductase [Thermodesulfovibrio sp.]|uniref:adenosylcobalamin-dependent ribonucleoside-diphosphate reductase n=1 Tax=unclassified Thermodesulfovibrio TaxID=2645936 RepID=UPI00083B1DDE|nr:MULTISPECIES: adenosylcobalamin-dependent ribonucleoside-diphosphate reductase [unclassified Thermodesulfovibrio]MDI1472545.1 adenosylcobalamin-dependent ribonucleoside-diphosphate reductase [Thermodesulfovibrio sp. 1176]MDI6714418.1 adenosylcobalamin-dependent ribonucleoside-diphosphate reductase [Thermodesulfovibrio sp.]ODA44881.1 Ribonucleotide reductase of class II (coenzyme B12-dependent) [Thermodesulfovibrio sp. N1]
MIITERARTVLEIRYLLKNEKGEVIETPDEMFKRVSNYIATAENLYKENSEEWAEKFYELISSLRFLPNSPALMNAGKPKAQLAACFVLPVEDSIEAIFKTLKDAALILQSGGGTGFNFSHLRPKGDVVRSTGGIASGPVSFMKIFDRASDIIKQGGARRGANMGILRVDHPDILEFVRIKRIESLSNFNISVAVTDSFMEALFKDDYYPLINPRNGEIVKKIKAKEVFDEIIKSAWETGDPGVIFIDTINKYNPTPHIGQIESTNPCGEQPLLPYEACILGSLNLSKYVKDKKINYELLEYDIKTATRFLDDAIDVTHYPVPEVEAMHKGNRKIGLGVMGWADCLVELEIPYNHKRAFHLAESLMKFIKEKSHEASQELAQKRGVFPNFKGSVWEKEGIMMRNATTTTIAPTGTISIIADCSSGIEPYFLLAYKQRILDTEFEIINKYLVEIAQKESFYSDEFINTLRQKGTLRGIKGIPSKVKELFKTALEISPEEHIEMQASFQKYIDNAVSKTINLPQRTKKEEVAKIFILAYKKGLKGITIFRYGSKRGTLLKVSDAHLTECCEVKGRAPRITKLHDAL